MHGRMIPTTPSIRAAMLRCCICTPSNQHVMLYAPQSCRSLEALNQQNKPKKKMGRPRLPKGEAKGRIVPVRFDADTIKRIATSARESNQTVSEWIRTTVNASIGG